MILFNVRFYDCFLQRTLWKKWRECTKGLISDFYTCIFNSTYTAKGEQLCNQSYISGKSKLFFIYAHRMVSWTATIRFPRPSPLSLWSASLILYISPPLSLSNSLSMSVILSLGLSIFLLLSHNTPYLFSVSPPLPNPPRSAYIKCKAN